MSKEIQQSELWQSLSDNERKQFKELNPVWAGLVERYGLDALAASRKFESEDDYDEDIYAIRQSCVVGKEVNGDTPNIGQWHHCIVGEARKGDAYYSYGDGCQECEHIALRFDSNFHSNESFVANLRDHILHIREAHS